MCSKPVEDLGYVHYISFDKHPMLGRSLDEFQSVSAGRGATGATVLDILEEELSDGYWHYKDDLVDAVTRQVRCSVKTIQRVAFEELKVDTELTETTPPKSKWRLPVTVT